MYLTQAQADPFSGQEPAVGFLHATACTLQPSRRSRDSARSLGSHNFHCTRFKARSEICRACLTHGQRGWIIFHDVIASTYEVNGVRPSSTWQKCNSVEKGANLYAESLRTFGLLPIDLQQRLRGGDVVRGRCTYVLEHHRVGWTG